MLSVEYLFADVSKMVELPRLGLFLLKGLKMEWIFANWETVFAILGVIITACSSVVAILPPAKEGTFYAKVVSLLDKASVIYAKYKK